MDQETVRGEVSEYRLYESIASGGFGTVYIGRDTATNVPVAIKRLHPHLKDQPGFVERFEKEVATVRGLTNAYIVRLLDQGRDSHGVPFIVMEWVEGLTVADWLNRRGRYSSTAAADVGCQVLEGLDAAWARRVVHRDIKPANLIVTPGGRLKIMDFGIAKDLDLATVAGTVGLIGTPAYMAPEQFRGQPLDCRADLYALGVTLYMMLAGRPPFEGPSFADYFRQHLEQEPPRIEDPADELDPGLVAVLHKALAKDPDDRFSTPAEMRAALRPYTAEQLPIGTPPGAEPTVVRQRELTQPVADDISAVRPVPEAAAEPEPTNLAPMSARTRPVGLAVGGIVALVVALVAGGLLFVSRPQAPQDTTAAPAPTLAASATSPPPAPTLAPIAPIAALPATSTPMASVPTWRLIGGADSALFSEPVGVAFDPQGVGYVSNNGTHTIDRLDATGKLTARWGGGTNGQPQLHNPGAIAADDTGAVYVADTGNNRILHFSSVGVVLGQAGSHGQAPGEFDGPRSVAVDGADNLYVADSGNHRIQKLAPDGKVVAAWGSFGTGPANLNFPYGVTLDSQGNVYVADRNNNRVVKLSAQGQPLAAWATASNADSSLTNPSSVAVDSSGNVYVAGWATDRIQRIQKLAPTGKLITSWTIDGKNPAQLSLPYQLAVGPHGNIHVAEVAGDRVDEFSPDGKAVGTVGGTRDALGVFRRPNAIGIDSHDRVYVTDWGNERVQSLSATPTQDQTQGPAQWGRFRNLQGVAVDRQGNIHVTEHDDCRVRKLSPTGETLGLWGSCGAAQGQFRDPEAIALDADGNAYVADRGNDRIVKLTPSGEVARTFGTHGSGDGQFDQPTGVALDAQGNLFVADRNNHRVVKLSSTGQIVALWGNQNNPALQLSAPEGVAVDPKGNLYIADWGSSRIIELSPSGDLLAQLGGAGSGLGQFDAPEGMAIDSQGRLYVADTGNNRVQEFAP